MGYAELIALMMKRKKDPGILMKKCKHGHIHSTPSCNVCHFRKLICTARKKPHESWEEIIQRTCGLCMPKKKKKKKDES